MAPKLDKEPVKIYNIRSRYLIKSLDSNLMVLIFNRFGANVKKNPRLSEGLKLFKQY